MAKYLSIDTEATGLEIDTYLIQVAVLPVDGDSRTVATHLGREIFVHCPSFEELKPKLNSWVVEHNEGLIRRANKEGLSTPAFQQWMKEYMESPEVKAFFQNERPPLLGKTLSALDIPLFTRYLGKDFMDKYFHYHTLDLTSVAHFLVDAGKLPKGCEGTSKLLKFFQVRDSAKHTALSDATDMAQIYLKLLDFMKPNSMA